MRMNLLVFMCVITILEINWVLAEPVKVSAPRKLNNEVLQIDVAFQDADIVPDIIRTSPGDKLRVIFDSIEGDFGNYISPVRMLRAPRFILEKADRDLYYAVLVVDADYPSRFNSVLRYGLLALFVNVVANGKGELLRDFVIAPWVPPSPPLGSGRHRFIALAYPQSCVLDTEDCALIELGVPRVRFNLDAFVKNYTTGELVAGNFWLTSIDECCNLVDSCNKEPITRYN